MHYISLCSLSLPPLLRSSSSKVNKYHTIHCLPQDYLKYSTVRRVRRANIILLQMPKSLGFTSVASFISCIRILPYLQYEVSPVPKHQHRMHRALPVTTPSVWHTSIFDTSHKTCCWSATLVLCCKFLPLSLQYDSLKWSNVNLWFLITG